VVTLDGRPERLLIRRTGDPLVQALGARAVARVSRVEKGSALAFLDLGEGQDAIANIGPDTPRLVEGQAIEIEIRSEARGGKGASARIVGPAEGAPRLLASPPTLEDRLRGFAPDADILTGPVARTVADGAQEDALSTEFPLAGGGSIAVEATRALTAVDVDLGGRGGGEAKRAARQANLAALAAAARILRLKGLGGLVVIDLIGRGHDAPALTAAARAAFAPDNPGVAIGAISRFGALELTVPRRARGAMDILLDERGALSPLSCALDLVRALEREAVADPGGRFEGLAAAEVVEAAGPAARALRARLGGRIDIRAEPDRQRARFEVVRL
jgi:Ribonuclease G/E